MPPATHSEMGNSNRSFALSNPLTMELTRALVAELRAWLPPSDMQQDDLTLIVVDVQ